MFFMIRFLGVLAMTMGLAIAAEEISTAQPSPEEMAQKAGVKLPPLPWHMTDIWWQLETTTPGFERLDIDVTIDRDISDAYNLYIAPVGIARMNGMDFYGGLQTNINGWENKESRKRVHPGKGAIFSRWSSDKATPIGLNHVRMLEGGLCESAGYEGQFCSVRRVYPWTKGTYTYSIRKVEKEMIDGKPHTWFGCFVKSHKDGKETQVGSLRFEGEDFTFWDRHAAFVEIYATSKIPKSGIPRCKVTFGYPMLNGKAPKLKSAFAVYNPKGKAASPQCARAKSAADRVEIEISEIIARDVPRETLDLKLP